MALYTFYPCTSDGSSTTFETIELPSDEMATERAERVLRDHGTSQYVAIWAGDRFVERIVREPAERARSADSGGAQA